MELVAAITKFLQDNGVLGLLVLLLVSFAYASYKQIIVWGWQLVQERAEKLDWKTKYFAQVEKTDRSIQLATDLAAAQQALQIQAMGRQPT